MRVLFLTKYPVEGASSRYRVYQYLPELEKLGLECTVSSFMDRHMYQLTFSAGSRWRKAVGLVKSISRRLSVLRNWRDYDVIVMQRELFPFGPTWVERYLRAGGARLVFDYDDALFIPKPGKFNPGVARLRSAKRFYSILRQCVCVLAGNDYLRQIAEPYCADVRVLHVAEDVNRFGERGVAREDGKIVIGWLGSPTTEKYLQLIARELEELLQDFPNCTLRIVGGGDFRLPGLAIEHVDWSLHSEAELLAGFDIGIMPLPLEKWSLGKSGGKARTYMAAGLPVVCTAVGYNLELLDNGKTGYLVESGEEWTSALRLLINDAGLRSRLGRQGREYVAKNFSVAGQAARLAAILYDIGESESNVHDPG
jgi:glycosyltransferase involved in cell wall biosynthesis